MPGVGRGRARRRHDVNPTSPKKEGPVRRRTNPTGQKEKKKHVKRPKGPVRTGNPKLEKKKITSSTSFQATREKSADSSKKSHNK